MADVTLLHNDDEVLDPSDSTLRTRGSVEVDGKEKGSWEEHQDGTWTAVLDGESFSESSKEVLVAKIGASLG